MSLQIDLFSDKHLMDNTLKIMAPLTRREFKLSKSISEYNNMQPDSIYMKRHLKEVLTKYNKPRSHYSRFGLKIDSHIELEKIGVGMDSKPYRIIISLEDSLDYLLHCVCNADIQAIYENVPDYKRISRGMLNIDFDLLVGLGFNALVGVDHNLDRYLNNLLQEYDDVRESVFYLYKVILEKAQAIISYIAVALKYYYEERGIRLVIKSRSACSIVLASDEPISEEILINNEYIIKVRSYKIKEYTEHVDETWRGGIQ